MTYYCNLLFSRHFLSLSVADSDRRATISRQFATSEPAEAADGHFGGGRPLAAEMVAAPLTAAASR